MVISLSSHSHSQSPSIRSGQELSHDLGVLSQVVRPRRIQRIVEIPDATVANASGGGSKYLLDCLSSSGDFPQNEQRRPSLRSSCIAWEEWVSRQRLKKHTLVSHSSG